MRTTIDASQLRVTGCLGFGVNGIAFSAVSPALPTNVQRSLNFLARIFVVAMASKSAAGGGGGGGGGGTCR